MPPKGVCVIPPPLHIIHFQIVIYVNRARRRRRRIHHRFVFGRHDAQVRAADLVPTHRALTMQRHLNELRRQKSESCLVSANHLCRERFARRPFPSSPLPSSALCSYSPAQRLNMPPAERCGCECVNTRRDLGTGSRSIRLT